MQNENNDDIARLQKPRTPVNPTACPPPPGYEPKVGDPSIWIADLVSPSGPPQTRQAPAAPEASSHQISAIVISPNANQHHRKSAPMSVAMTVPPRTTDCKNCGATAGRDDIIFCPECRQHFDDPSRKYWDYYYSSELPVDDPYARAIFVHNHVRRGLQMPDKQLQMHIKERNLDIWVEWVQQTTPYGLQAEWINLWYQDDFRVLPPGTGNIMASTYEYGPCFESTKAGMTEIRNCFELAHLQHMKPIKGAALAVAKLNRVFEKR